MMKGLSIAPAPAPRPGAAAALDQYAREQLSTRLKYVFGRIDIKGDGRIDAEELAEMLVQLGCTPRKKKKGDRETVMCARIAPYYGSPRVADRGARAPAGKRLQASPLLKTWFGKWTRTATGM